MVRKCKKEIGKNEKKKKLNDFDVVTAVNYGVGSSASWSSCIGNPETDITRVRIQSKIEQASRAPPISTKVR